eukprot:gene684-243_t
MVSRRALFGVLVALVGSLTTYLALNSDRFSAPLNTSPVHVFPESRTSGGPQPTPETSTGIIIAATKAAVSEVHGPTTPREGTISHTEQGEKPSSQGRIIIDLPSREKAVSATELSSISFLEGGTRVGGMVPGAETAAVVQPPREANNVLAMGVMQSPIGVDVRLRQYQYATTSFSSNGNRVPRRMDQPDFSTEVNREL